MARRIEHVTDAQWAKIEPLLPKLKRSRRGGPTVVGAPAGVRGHPVAAQVGGAVEGSAGGVSEPCDLLALAETLGGGRGVAHPVAHVPGGVGSHWAAQVERVFHRRRLRAGEKGGLGVGLTKRGKGSKRMVLVERQGIPLGGLIASATPAEVTLVDATLATVRVPRLVTAGRPRQTPPRLIADRGYDSNRLRAALAQRGIEPIIPATRNHPNATHQDGRKLRRYRHRWIVERSTAWFDGFRRLVVRWERHLSIYRAFFHLACAMIALRWL